MTTGRRPALAWPWLLGLAGVYAAARSPFLDFVPLWDGRVYYHCARYASYRHIDLIAADCHNHVSPFLMYLLHLPSALAPGNMVAFNGSLIVVGVIAILAFHELVRWGTGDRLGPGETVLYAALLAFHPVILASFVNVNLDLGVLTFFLLYAACLVRDRPVAAALAGVALIFSKETGLLLLPLVPAALFLGDRARRRVAWLVHVSPALLLPAVLFVGYALYKTVVRDQPLFWERLGGEDALLRQLVDPFQRDAYLATQLVQLFVLQFHWVLTAIIAGLATAYLLARHGARTRRAARLDAVATERGWRVRVLRGAELVHQRLAVSGLLFATTLYVLTRFRPHSNPRYLLPLYALLLLLLVQLLAAVVRRPLVRLVAAGGILVGLFGPSLLATPDPVSRRLMGTFEFGRHPMLRMTALTGECCGAGRDQLVYNLQFTRFHYLQDTVFRAIRPTEDTVILVAWAANFALLDTLSVHDYARTLAADGVFWPRYGTAEAYAVREDRASEVYFLAFPNVDNRPALEGLGRVYAHREVTVYGAGGYELAVHRFAASAGGPATGRPPGRGTGRDRTGPAGSGGGTPRPSS